LIYLVTEFSIFPAIINVTILFSLFECRKFVWKSWGKSSGEVLELVLSGKWEPFLQQLPRPAASSPLHCWQLFRCWPSGVELPATGGYVGTVSGDLLH